jgi:hypothetical protein
VHLQKKTEKTGDVGKKTENVSISAQKRRATSAKHESSLCFFSIALFLFAVGSHNLILVFLEKQP